jgi:FSR family fosmidomycin resistance protein-like MFS transporter
LAAIGFCHFLNDLRQPVRPAVYPILKEAYRLDFRQIGLITLSVQLTASLLQPFVGIYTDHRPTPYSLPVGMGFTLSGLLLLAFAPRFGMILLAVALVGVGSSVFHPESSRGARMASGGQHGGRWARCWPRWSYFREPAQHRVVLHGGAACHYCIGAHWGLVQGPRRG